MSKKSSSKVRFTAQQVALQTSQMQLAQIQVDASQRQDRTLAAAEQVTRGVVQDLDTQAQVGRLTEELTRESDITLDEETAKQAPLLFENQLRNLFAGGQATEQDLALISSGVENALAAGGADIERGVQTGLELLKTLEAPRRGLRPTDSPIVDRGSRIVAEGVRSFGQLSAQLRAQAANQALTLPLQRQGIQAQIGSDLQAQNLALRDFKENLRQTAFMNRFQLGFTLTGAGTAGFNTATDAGTKSRSFDPVALAGGVGGALTGLGTAKQAGIFSAKKLKNIAGKIDAAGADAVLEKVKELEVGEWSYKGDPEHTLHIGPYAEDFQATFGKGDGTSIPIVDMLGVQTTAIKAIAHKLDKTDARMDDLSRRIAAGVKAA